jgi:hypothetical protein
MLTRLRKVPLRLCLREARPERLTGSWGSTGRKNPKRAAVRYRALIGLKPLHEPKAKS